MLKFNFESHTWFKDFGRHWFLRGITSFGVDACGSGRPAAYTDVEVYRDWIIDTVYEEETKQFPYASSNQWDLLGTFFENKWFLTHACILIYLSTTYVINKAQ